jgi:hypothetical protein
MLACALAPAAQLSAAPDVAEIIAKVDQANRKAFATQLTATKIVTCRYTVVNGSAACSEKPRTVVADSAKKTVIDGHYNPKVLLVVREPISDRGTGLLVFEYEESGRDNDNWVYLPALGKTNRVIASDDNGGSVFGSEFSVETMENPPSRKMQEYTYKVLEETNLQERAVWVIEMVPVPEKAKKSSLNKVVAWIDQETYLPLKEDIYRNGKIYKQRIQSDLRQVDGVFMMAKVVMNNLSTSRISQMTFPAVRHNLEIPDEYLGQRALTDFAFRERMLNKLNGEMARGASANRGANLTSQN